jgi:hypothetical protein
MGHSIQEIAKKINSVVSIPDLVSLGASALLLASFAIFITQARNDKQGEVAYRTDTGTRDGVNEIGDLRPFGSRNGSTYTYSWCQGADRILAKNKIVYDDEAQATSSGRTLSKLCAK